MWGKQHAQYSWILSPSSVACLCPLPIFLLGAFLFLMDFQELLEYQVSSIKYVVNVFSHFVLLLCALCYKEVLNHDVIICVDLFFYHY